MGVAMTRDISRRRFLKVVGLGSAAAVALRSGLGLHDTQGDRVSRTSLMMGTLVTIEVVGMDRIAADAAADATLRAMSQLEGVLSRYRSTSQVGMLNTYGSVSNPDPALVDVLRRAQEVNTRTKGAFDVTVGPVVDLFERYAEAAGIPPPAEIEAAAALVDQNALIIDEAEVRLEGRGRSITLDGIAKGYIVDRGAAVLAEHGCTRVLVEAGGDLATSSPPAGPWRVGIRAPRPGMKESRLDLAGGAVATSGDYQSYFTEDLRHHHIVDARVGVSNRTIASATVAAANATLADAVATAVMAMGVEEGLDLINSWDDVEALIVDKGGGYISSRSFYS